MWIVTDTPNITVYENTLIGSQVQGPVKDQCMVSVHGCMTWFMTWIQVVYRSRTRVRLPDFGHFVGVKRELISI
jgi:hypothetical protein